MVKAAVAAVGACALAWALSGCNLPGADIPEWAQRALTSPVTEDLLSGVLPHGEVSPEDVPFVPEDTVLVCDDPELTGEDRALKRLEVIINIRDYDDALDIVQRIPKASGITRVGTFVISDEMLAKVQAELDKIAGRHPAFLLLDLETGAGLAYNIDSTYYSASSIKGINIPAICALCSGSFEANKSLMESTLVYSDNAAYERVFDTYNERIPNISNAWRKKARLDGQYWDRLYTNYSTREFAQLWCVTWGYLIKDTETTNTLRGWMSASRHSCFADAFGGREGYTVCSKAGWENTAEKKACCEGGFLVTPGGTYLLCVMTDWSGYPEAVFSGLVNALDEAYQEYAPQKAME